MAPGGRPGEAEGGRGAHRDPEAVSPGLPPAVRSRAGRHADEGGQTDVVPDQRPGAAERSIGLGTRCVAGAPSGLQACDRLPRFTALRVLGRRAARPFRQGRGRCAWCGDPARALLRHRQVRSRDRPRLGDPRRVRLRDERVLEAHRLAGRRDRRRARDAVAEPLGQRSHTAASGSTTATSSSCATASRSGRRSRSSASRKDRADVESIGGYGE